ncbi:MAG: hypothetical protein IPM24_24385 [Bryobacterales bacterium]|jgi:hypothetical protein|nr:hypothetical protein [Bryobacterales bacterium]
MDILRTGLEGLGRAELMLNRAAERIARLPVMGDAARDDEVVLSDEFVQLIEARNLFSANVKTIQAGDEMRKHLLDELG